MSTFLFAVFPYLAMAVFVVGMIWRYKYDKFGWTTRSSQLYESKLLRIGSPLFHYGILMAVLGHAMGLVIPKGWTDAMGIDQHTYHLVAVIGGVTAGLMVTIGFIILVFRRRTVKTVFNATTVNDKVMYLVLGLNIFFGMWNTISTALGDEHFYNYREGVSVWFRSIFMAQPNVEAIAMVGTPIQFQVHAVLSFLLIMIWPFTRLVHVFSAPVQYLARPYIVYRSKGDTGQRPTPSRAPQGTWKSPTASKR
ncbi:respiratory nitrate reductase subunit gamma [Propioniciclava sp. MC1595]|uniref:respiratory nitrate reductase subunit gamma n=1 Tax=Propioniciclava sp. MC1595 TaxID=2760308 RepID=UPI0016625BD8|nr:respiratory nitrate reductase subunit gamma [Propioniciclava sp. MC1595]MBB1493613.1 respiratory nitrate reductase subunit gamma [Propioniciclava sp. MC1595]QTE27003.1 respiratory nitrate reductase subunit gamma [Propioniciclava sp. MC1595]